MATVHNFRSSLSGFNRQDVVNYIEYINNKHNSELEQLNTQLQTAQEALAHVSTSSELAAKLEAAEARCAELEALLASGVSPATAPGSELEVYRRAERAERLARDRAAQIYAKANAALADATVKVEAISDGVNALAEQFSLQMQEGKQQLQEAVASLYEIRPEEE